ncbi:molybdopterin molybdotransferase MoeA [Pseudoduganella namucuonensis]|uniref:Molybdopterin molybdenumtransferase n=1 Tax=Pseudoduganella namucuonensis TaxID=1035707 RepID=A0A1I7HB54_9BURK|nr:gephyrin-like molybdotransferase Glp [Pseudoduganella namucuonensis]SFU57822.1 molybdopterin molybdotransferase [Pseudoduganella namucuonensis]
MSDAAKQQPKPMLTVRQALDFLLSATRPVADTETLPTLEANGRILARAQVSGMNVPAQDNTQMDGYAVRAADCASGAATLTVSQRIPAGQVGQPLLPGTAARIFTGALIPEGADAVVMQEQCELTDALANALVTIRHAPKPGEWIRRAGEDISTGAIILGEGTRLRSQELGLAASVGLAELPVRRKLRVAVFFTGDELAMPGEPLAPGAIYNSNRYTLRALLENLGCEISDFGIVPDSLDATRSVLRQAAQGNDLIITSGGVSVGEEDHVKPAVEAEGKLNMWQIAMKPGKPLAFGEVRDAFFVGLPGNPVSSFVTFLMLVRPFILRLQGVSDPAALEPRSYQLRADFNWLKADRRNEFLRVKLNPRGGLDLFPNQGSGVLTSTVWGDGLVDNPAGQAIRAGDTVRFIPFSELI